MPDGGGDIHYLWCSCPGCGKLGIEFDGRGARVCGQPTADAAYLPNKCIRENGRKIGHPDKGYSFDDPRIVAAATTARSTRFH
jgi:hypothetical protein